LHGTPLGPGECQDGVGRAERVWEKLPPHFSKNGGKFLDFLKNVQNVL